MIFCEICGRDMTVFMIELVLQKNGHCTEFIKTKCKHGGGCEFILTAEQSDGQA